LPRSSRGLDVEPETVRFPDLQQGRNYRPRGGSDGSPDPGIVTGHRSADCPGAVPAPSGPHGPREHGVALVLAGIGVEDEHVQQADRQGHGHAAGQQPLEHRPRPRVLDQRADRWLAPSGSAPRGTPARRTRRSSPLSPHRHCRQAGGAGWGVVQPDVLLIRGKASFHRVRAADPLKLRRSGLGHRPQATPCHHRMPGACRAVAARRITTVTQVQPLSVVMLDTNRP